MDSLRKLVSFLAILTVKVLKMLNMSFLVLSTGSVGVRKPHFGNFL